MPLMANDVVLVIIQENAFTIMTMRTTMSNLLINKTIIIAMSAKIFRVIVTTITTSNQVTASRANIMVTHSRDGDVNVLFHLQIIVTLMIDIAIKSTVRTHFERSKRMNITSIITQTVNAMNALLPLHLTLEFVKPLWHPYGMRKNAYATIAKDMTTIHENVPISRVHYALAMAT